MYSISFRSVYELIGVAVRSTDAWKMFVTVATVKIKAIMTSLIAYTTILLTKITVGDSVLMERERERESKTKCAV